MDVCVCVCVCVVYGDLWEDTFVSYDFMTRDTIVCSFVVLFCSSSSKVKQTNRKQFHTVVSQE